MANKHEIILNWVDSTDMPLPYPAGDGYNIFKGIAPTIPGATPINSVPVAATTYTDTAVTPGFSYEYYITTVIGGSQSPDSVLVTSNPVPIFPPTGLSAVAS